MAEGSCNVCWNLNVHHVRSAAEQKLLAVSARSELYDRSRQPTTPSLNSSASSCPFCNLLFQGATAGLKQMGLISDPAGAPEIDVFLAAPGHAVEATFTFKDQMSRPLLAPFEFFSEEGAPCPAGTCSVARLITNSSRSVLAPGGLASQWLDDCSRNHAQCGKHDEQVLPTRVIDVSGDELFLYATAPGEKGRYICLSYCWGGPQRVMTTVGTLAERKRGITYSNLPLTLRDAVDVTRDLGIRYIWIDALCIVQDDLLDWQRESAAMADVYGNSYLTISASASPSAEAGMFIPPTNNTQAWCFPVSATLANGEELRMIARRMERHRDLVRQSPIEDSPLVKRAWCFQEHLLPTRVLQFGTREAVWECSESTCCSCSVELMDAADVSLKKPFTRQLSESRPDSGDDSWALWSAIIQGYAGRSLTQGTDKLVALSGVARRLQESWNCRYVAGLWETSLVRWLCWSATESTHVLPPRPSPYRAPTWSWASIDRAIKLSRELNQFASPQCSVEATILDVKCIPATNDMSGAISGAKLVISGPLIQAEYIGKSAAGFYMLRCGSRENRFNPDADLGPFTEPTPVSYFCLLHIQIDPRDQKYRAWRLEPNLPWYKSFMLVLKRALGLTGGFERIGIMEYWHNGSDSLCNGVEKSTVSLV
ncbi:heterokaryon incompatibility protein-domain-containing protein [Schizothecium vesticola]|uniref:Heterokaryon incompatibility protein-domain-containing protein n=1 Tax=Schizothecium vesticola TaxID=314040 RepID=A0AA40EFI9_9PEZI|nr:heterokaryon incompatibility protein-domain-containing protein [Schizothecium vesticola]